LAELKRRRQKDGGKKIPRFYIFASIFLPRSPLYLTGGTVNIKSGGLPNWFSGNIVAGSGQ
jgi:hypothetical protein